MENEMHLLTHEFLPFRGGIGVYVEETARALGAAGAKVTVWAPEYGAGCGDSFPFQTRRIPMRGRQDWVCRLRMAKAVRGAFPDGTIPGTVVLAEPGPIRLWMYAQLLALPVPERLVLILHGTEVRALSRILHRRRLFQKLVGRADRVGVVSNAVRDMTLQVFPEAESKLVVVPGAVRGRWRDLPPVARDPDTRLLLQVGRFHPRKGQDILLKAIALLPPDCLEGLQVRLLGPSGKGRYFRDLKAFVEEHRLPVRIEENLDEPGLRAAYQSATLLVMPSRPSNSSIEGLGLALLEAQHFGCPVIGSRFGGIPEALLEDETGLLVPPAQPEALARAIRRLLQDRGEAAAMGRAAAGFVRQSFSWQENIRRLGLA